MIYNCMYRAFKNGPILKGRWNTETGLIEGVIKQTFFFQEPILIDRFKDYVADFKLTRLDTENMYDILARNPDVYFVVMFAATVVCYVKGQSVIDKDRGKICPRSGGNIFEGPCRHIGYLKTVPLNYSEQIYQHPLYVAEGMNGEYLYTQYGQWPVTFPYDKTGKVVGMTFVELSNTPDNVLGFYTYKEKARLLYKN